MHIHKLIQYYYRFLQLKHENLVRQMDNHLNKIHQINESFRLFLYQLNL